MNRRGPSRFAFLLLPLLLGAGGGGDAPHDLHIAYGDLGIEGAVMAGRMRFFKDDLERALGPMLRVDAVALTPGPEADALVLRYLRERFVVRVGDAVLMPEVLASGEDLLDREPVWWVTLRWTARAPVTALTVRNTLLFELYDDQRNVVKFVHFPEQTPRTFYFADGEDEHAVRFAP